MGIPAEKREWHYTYKDYREWPDDERWELIDGVAYNMSPAPTTPHQGIGLTIASELRAFLKGKPCQVFIAPCDVFFPRVREQDEDSVDTVVQPDVLVVCDPGKILTKGIWGAPDLVVEILSPSTSKKDLREKFDLYERSGVREYWVIEPRARWLQVHRLAEGRYASDRSLEEAGEVVSAVLPGFRLDLETVWPVVPGASP